MRVRLLNDTLAVATFRLRHELLVNGQRSAPVMPDRIYLSRPDARSAAPWRVASLGVTPFVASGRVADRPRSIHPRPARPCARELDEPVAPGPAAPRLQRPGASP